MLGQIADKGVGTSAYDTKKGGKAPAYYCATIDKPQKGDWDIGGPTRGDLKRKTFKGKKATVKKGQNFTQDTWPYWNNAHHLIPKGTLKMAIANEDDADVGRLMEKGLLGAEYNINHKINMLFLPQDEEVGRILDMPRHLALKVGDDEAVKDSCTNHPVYNDMVKEMKDGLKDIIAGYRETIKDATKEKCEAPDFKLDKQKLEELSGELLEMILEWEGGRSLDSLSQQFGNLD